MGTVLTLIAFFGTCCLVAKPNVGELATKEYEEDR